MRFIWNQSLLNISQSHCSYHVQPWIFLQNQFVSLVSLFCATCAFCCFQYGCWKMNLNQRIPILFSRLSCHQRLPVPQSYHRSLQPFVHIGIQFKFGCLIIMIISFIWILWKIYHSTLVYFSCRIFILFLSK